MRKAAEQKMTLAKYLAGITAASTVAELEEAIQAPFDHRFSGPTWTRICKARIAAGEAICEAHPLGQFVPRFGARRQLSVCGETYKVGRGQNSTGVRYVWHYAKVWAVDVLRKNGLSTRAAHRIWDVWDGYPHRALQIIEDALAGKLLDPVLDTIVYYDRPEGSPIRYTVEQNAADAGDRRATRSCRCGGTLFDWGAGHSQGFDFISWRCNACPDVGEEFLSPGRLTEIRSEGHKRQSEDATDA